MKRVLWSEDGTGEPAGKIVAMVTHAAHPCPPSSSVSYLAAEATGQVQRCLTRALLSLGP